jgi:hypothetical protein
MYRYGVTCLVLAFLGGCAASPPGAETGVSAISNLDPTTAESVAAIPSGQMQKAPTVASTLIGSNTSDEICESTALPGSRIVTGKHCYSPSARDANTRSQLEELRREQEMRERAERDREMQRQRSSMSALFP